MSGSISILIILAAYAASLALTALTRAVLQKRALLDHPNERSSHKIPVPRGGGLAIMAVVIPGMLLAAWRLGNLPGYLSLIAGAAVLALISWHDDRKGASAGMRLGAHIFAACIGSLAFPPDQVIFGGVLPFWLDRTVMIIGWAWFMNLYNFMDGIDGITSVETVSIATGVCLIMTAASITDPFADTLTLLLTGASLGFLVFNWHPAKIFLGDVGSVPLGYLCGFLLLMLAVHGQWAPALILPLYYLADSGITLAHRIARHKKIWQAHREHFYQRAVQALGKHDRVVIWIVAANIVLMGAAILAITNRWAGLISAAFIIVILLWKMYRLPIFDNKDR